MYNQSALGNSLARDYNIENKNKWIFEAGLSSVLSVKYDFALSGTFQLMFRISYQFKTGKEKPIINREKEDIPKRIKPGL
ncbi:MAG: hypothetical protein ACOC10_04420 [Bacteroidota bacterium]